MVAEQSLFSLQAEVNALKASNEELQRRLTELYERIWCRDCSVPYGSGMFSDADLLKLIEKGRIRLDPLPNLAVAVRGSALGTCKIDLRLGAEFLIPNSHKIKSLDLRKSVPENYFEREYLLEDEELIIKPGMVIIGTTLERLVLADDLFGRMEGKSGVARKGGAVQLAAVFDAGWDGYPMMELHNITNTPLTVHLGDPICAMSFGHLSSKTLRAYAQRDGVTYAIQEGARI